MDVGGSVFSSHEVFGLDLKPNRDDDSPPTRRPAAREDEDDDEEEEEGGNGASSPTRGKGKDKDKDKDKDKEGESVLADCVICLSDERSVLVYPCRHLCLCADCAESLPVQNCRCPICRQPASLLLRLVPPGGLKALGGGLNSATRDGGERGERERERRGRL